MEHKQPRKNLVGLGEQGPPWSNHVGLYPGGFPSFDLLLLLDLTALWFWPHFVLVGCLWASFAIFFDLQGL